MYKKSEEELESNFVVFAINNLNFVYISRLQHFQLMLNIVYLYRNKDTLCVMILYTEQYTVPKYICVNYINN